MMHLGPTEEYSVARIDRRGHSAEVDCSDFDPSHQVTRFAAAADCFGSDPIHPRRGSQIVAVDWFDSGLVHHRKDHRTVAEYSAIDQKDHQSADVGSVRYCQTVLRLVVVDSVYSVPSSQIVLQCFDLGSAAYSDPSFQTNLRRLAVADSVDYSFPWSQRVHY